MMQRKLFREKTSLPPVGEEVFCEERVGQW